MAGEVKPDVVLVWPTSCDYPLWRRHVKAWRALYARVVVSFHVTQRRYDYRDFVREELAALGVSVVEGSADWPWHDWRSSAVNRALGRCESDWVLFTEPDLFVEDARAFWDAVRRAALAADVVSREEQGTGRLHPCFILARRNFVEATRKDFSVTEDGDHFARFALDLERAGARIDTLTMRTLEDAGAWRHMAGLSHNHHLLADGQEVTYRPDEFRWYLIECLASGESLHPVWRQEAAEYVTTAP